MLSTRPWFLQFNLKVWNYGTIWTKTTRTEAGETPVVQLTQWREPGCDRPRRSTKTCSPGRWLACKPRSAGQNGRRERRRALENDCNQTYSRPDKQHRLVPHRGLSTSEQSRFKFRNDWPDPNYFNVHKRKVLRLAEEPRNSKLEKSKV